MEAKPIKRSGYLVTLSRDHHGGLLFCWKIRQGLNLSVAVARLGNYARFFWENHLKEHFQEEEILLFNQLDHELTRRAKVDHLVLQTWFDRILNNSVTSEADYGTFIGLLNDHIRFEERQVFSLLEQQLPANVLAGIRDILIRLHAQPFEDNYADEFWIKS